MAKVEEIIIVEISRGRGIKHDPCRLVTQFWSKEGELLAEKDPVQPKYCPSSGQWAIPDGQLTFPQDRMTASEILARRGGG